MKKEIIKTQDYLLVVDDSEIKKGDCYLSPSGIWFYNHLNPNHVKECQKIIAHLPLNDSPILEGVPLLPPLDEGVFITPTHFEFETEITHEGNGTYSTDLMDIGLSNLTPIKAIKTTTNSQGQKEACGKYIY